MSDQPDLDALREKAEKATPGPWKCIPWDEEIDEGEEGTHIIGMASYLDNQGHYQTDHLIRWEHSLYPEDGEQYDRANATAEHIAAASPDVLLAVLSLVDDQQKEIERLREALTVLSQYPCISDLLGEWPEDGCECGSCFARRALAGSPAANEEQQ